MITWFAVSEQRVDVRRTNRDGHGGYPVGVLHVRRVLARIAAETRADARRLAPPGTDMVVSEPSLRVSDPCGWLHYPVGVPVVEETLLFQSPLARQLVAQRRAQVLRVA